MMDMSGLGSYSLFGAAIDLDGSTGRAGVGAAVGRGAGLAVGVGRGVPGPLSLSTGPCVVGLAVGVGLGGS